MQGGLLYPYRFVNAGGNAWSAENAHQGLRFTVTAAGVETGPLRPSGRAWSVRLDAKIYGRRGSTRLLPEPTVEQRSNRMSLDHAGLLETWYVHDMDGLEQGWTLNVPPPGSRTEPVCIELSVFGSGFLLDPDARGGCFTDEGQAPLAWYRDLRAWDAKGHAVEAWIERTSAGLRICAKDRDASYPLTIDPLITGPVWSVNGMLASERFGADVDSGDLNGDGLPDLVVGASHYGGGASERGRVRLYLGGATGLATSAAWTFQGEASGAHLGSSVRVVGDVNGDGFEDLLVAAPDLSVNGTSSGRAYLFLGSAQGPGSVPDWTLDGANACAFLGEALAALGDVNGDGLADFGVGSRGHAHSGAVFAFHGAPGLPSNQPAWTALGNKGKFGRSIAGAGDVNDDGFDDLLVGQPDSGLGGKRKVGRALLYLGSSVGLAPTPAWTFDGDQGGAELGRAVRGAGDVNADGFDDLLIGEPYRDNPLTDAGRVHLFLGGPGGPALAPDQVIEGPSAGGRMGMDLGAAGDLDGDGFADAAFGAPGFAVQGVEVGRAFVHSGSGSGLSPLAEVTLSGTQPGESFAESLAVVSDVDGDGLDDLLLGAPGRDAPSSTLPDSGRAILFQGGLRTTVVPPLPTSPDWCYTVPTLEFGTSLARIDVNDDGYDDLLVGAPLGTTATSPTGEAVLFLGSASGLESTPFWSVSAPPAVAFAPFARKLDSAGDVNGDGFEDILVANAFPLSAHLFYGGAGTLGSVPDWSTFATMHSSSDDLCVSGAGDVNGDGYDDVLLTERRPTNPAGRVVVFFGSPQGLSSQPDWIYSPRVAMRGSDSRGVGDVDGDGFDDIAIGLVAAGRVEVHRGSPTGPLTAVHWFAANILGASLSGGTDLNGDGLTDLVVGNLGRAWAYFGTGTTYANPASWRSQAIGGVVDSRGDIDGDGLADLVLGLPSSPSVRVVLGSRANFGQSVNWVYTRPSQTDFGTSVAMGDFDGDGFSDVAVGDTDSNNPQAGDESSVFVFLSTAK